MARRRRRTPPPDARPPLPWDELCPTLDLHGETAESARRLTERWLREHRADGIRLVRVVTGRGRRSLGPPVLRGEVEDLLRALRGDVVAKFTSDSGGGAYRVELRRPAAAGPASRRPPPPPIPPDPALRRRAEESLLDLGIDPTPALVEAEMRRIREGRGGGSGER